MSYTPDQVRAALTEAVQQFPPGQIEYVILRWLVENYAWMAEDAELWRNNTRMTDKLNAAIYGAKKP